MIFLPSYSNIEGIIFFETMNISRYIAWGRRQFARDI